MSTVTGLRRVVEDLWETTSDTPAPGLTTHAYLWTPGTGRNTLFYSVASDRDFDGLDRLGGVAHQYLSHRDEAGPGLVALRSRFGARLHAPAAEADEIAHHRRPDELLGETGRDTHGIGIVATPGHSPGSTSFVVDGAAGRYLFTGDTLYRGADGSWRAGYIPGVSDADPLFASLDRLAALQPDLVVSSAYAGDSGVHRVDRETWTAVVEQARSTLTAALS